MRGIRVSSYSALINRDGYVVEYNKSRRVLSLGQDQVRGTMKRLGFMGYVI